ncbi:ABC transporter ATP-binding protein [Vibrio rumoiensis]|uniref:Methionine ABC transporter ATP-binding protein n=1 Tax=Vibrio rumoiensis 1S-45 TaxID=1188252 RepID=A0A1E5DYZ6_9VIBR|nr:ABC transporter ATP-binding protein [Vibrio rumoiensis]OEF23041.1 methionine ABC transporter ATP-binding protein [Vibrio rumoiensis 1S-45]
MTSLTPEFAIQLSQIQFAWPKQDTPTLLIDELTIPTQQHVFIKGPSGCGKSTLLSLLTGIITPQSGKITVLGQPLNQLNQARRDQFRSHHIGYIFQQFNLLPYLSVIDNVLLPCRFSKIRKQRALQSGSTLIEQAKQLLQRLHLPESVFERPISDLSIGQQQRVAAARALIGQPEIIIADEPTSALDHDNRQAFIELLIEEANRSQASVIFVSHDSSLQAYFDRTIDLMTINSTSNFHPQGEHS